MAGCSQRRPGFSPFPLDLTHKLNLTSFVPDLANKTRSTPVENNLISGISESDKPSYSGSADFIIGNLISPSYQSRGGGVPQVYRRPGHESVFFPEGRSHPESNPKRQSSANGVEGGRVTATFPRTQSRGRLASPTCRPRSDPSFAPGRLGKDMVAPWRPTFWLSASTHPG